MEQWQNIPWLPALFTTELILGVFFGIAFLLSKFPAARHLGKLLITYAFLLLSFLESSFPFNVWQLSIILGVVLYLYAKTFFTQKNRLNYIHLVPVVLAFVLLLTPTLVDQISSILIAIIYCFLIWKDLQREAGQRGIKWFENPGSRIVWFRNFMAINITCLVVLSTGFAGFVFIAAIMALVLLLVVSQAFRESAFFSPIPPGTKYQKSALTPQIKSAILDKIEGVMDEKFYLRDDASLANLATELKVTTHHLSQVLNESLQISFQDLIARYRIRKACQILRDEEYAQVKIESVAAMVGYNSKSSFNAAFKRRTGQTPTEYREAKTVRSYGGTPLSERKRPLYESPKFSLNHVFNIKMNSNMIRITFRNLRKNRLHSSLNILGLTIGLSAVLTIACYVHYELSYDKHHPDPENTYRIALNRIYPDYEKKWTLTAPILAPTITDELPEVLHYTRFSWDDILFAPIGEQLQSQRITSIDSGFFEVFDAKIISGLVTNEFFKREDGVILTESGAKKYFGKEDPIGKQFDLQLPMEREKRLLSVQAVIEDPLPNSHFSYEVLTVMKLQPLPPWMFTSWGTWGTYSYIRVQPGTDPVLLREKINEIAEKNQGAGSEEFEEWKNAGNTYDYFLQPLTNIHLHSNLAYEFEANSSVLFVYFFALVGGFILIMAVVNFVNLATARASYRTLEVGIRKVVGAGRGDLMIQFLLESLMISSIAMILALPLTQLLLPSFNGIIGKSITLDIFFTPIGVVILFTIPALLGLLSGIYPAIYLSGFGPASIIKKFNAKRGRESVRHILVIGQFIIAVILIIGTITVYRQMHYITNKPLGFDKDQLIKIDKLPFIGEKIEVFKAEANNIPGILGVSTTNFPLDDVRSGSTISTTPDDDGWVNTTFMTIDENYLPTMGIRLVAGRNFLPDEIESNPEGIDKILLNEAAVNALNVSPEEVINRELYDVIGIKCLVIGVIEDFQYESLRNPVQPLQLSSTKFEEPYRSATIRLNPRRMKESIGELEKLWNTLAPDKVFNYEYMDESMAQYYEAERLAGKLFVIFSGLGIFVCCLGLFGLMGYVVEQRAKEVGIRKVLGARIRNIVLLLSRDYIRLVLISSLIAIPIAWWGLNKWLDSFAFRIENSIWIFLLGGMLVILISWLTVALYAYQAAKDNPVNTLRSE